MDTLKKLRYLLDKKDKAGFVGVFILNFLASFAELLGIAIIMPIINLAMDQGELGANWIEATVMKVTGATTRSQVIWWLVAATILIYILKSVFLIYVYNHQFLFSMVFKRKVTLRLMNAYLKQPYSYHLNKNSSELFRCVDLDTASLFESVISLLKVMSGALMTLCIVGYLIITNPKMTLVIALILGFCCWLSYFVLNKKFRHYGKVNQEVSGELDKHVRQAFNGVKEIKIMENESYFTEAFDRTHHRKVENMAKYNIFSLIPKNLIETMCIAGILLFLGYSVSFNENYDAIIPQIAAFCVAAYKLLPAVNTIVGSMNTMVYAKAGVNQIYEDIKEVDELEKYDCQKEVAGVVDFQKDICLEGVFYRYEGMNKDVLRNVNLEIQKGQSIAFVGPSGGGKTTTADIILGLLEPTKGKVLVDGVDIHATKRKWGGRIGYIPQSIYLTDDTIRNNIAFGIKSEEIDEAKVWEAIGEAQLKEFVLSLPEGLDTMVGERGVRMSGGQRQRVGIARALYRNPDVLVFDEATSALDNETEKELMNSIEALQGKKTMIMIAHRLSTIEKCDVIYKVENGEVKRK
ncbi:MAG: ABC transporter ATP-binding protein/permease [Lachnospiraceae bacterium]|nr:ABC transporter ATP-binding protein/permease [Lachnospiraceae bacterium]